MLLFDDESMMNLQLIDDFEKSYFTKMFPHDEVTSDEWHIMNQVLAEADLETFTQDTSNRCLWHMRLCLFDCAQLILHQELNLVVGWGVQSVVWVLSQQTLTLAHADKSHNITGS